MIVRLRREARRLRRWTPAILLAALVAGLAAPQAAVGDEPAAPAPPQVLVESSTTVRYAPGRLVVGLEEDASAGEVEQIFEEADAEVKRSIGKLDARVVEAPKGQLQETIASLESSPAVEYVEREVVMEQADTVPNDALWSTQWGPARIRTVKAWDVTRGSSSVVIAVLDTGVDFAHPDLQGSFVAGRDIVNNDANPSDDHGHGTAAAGVIGARTHNQTGVAGMCWTCSLMPVKVLDSSGSGTTSGIAAGIIWAADHGAQVISMSLGSTGTTLTLANAVDYAAARGVLVVAAAGNAGSTSPFYPAAYPTVVSVAGTNSSDSLYSWSNRGSWVQVAAPGCNTAPDDGGGYINFCGTSSATPIVAGIAGLALSSEPSLTKAMLEHALWTSAVPIPGSVTYGRVDALGALAALELMPPVNVRRPRIEGVLRQGRQLTTSNGRWVGQPTSFTYQWRRCNELGKKCSAILGATAQTYVARRADIGHRLSVKVWAENDRGRSTSVSTATESIRQAKTAPRAATTSVSIASVPTAPPEPVAEEPAPPPPSPPPPADPIEAVVSQLESQVTEAAETASTAQPDPPG